MAVKHEIKSQLAKLLATEDLIIEHKQVETAQFNVSTRVLILPLWEKASNSVYDMLVGHEVGHAIFTPNVDPPSDIPHSFVNIVEDARIEKLMKRRYMGISKSFYQGYSELFDQDFFNIADEDVNEMNLADRVNLHFKVGNFVDISFNSEESVIVQSISDCGTWEDVIAAARDLYEYCKDNREESIDMPPQLESNKGSTSQEQSSESKVDYECEDTVDDSKGQIQQGSSDVPVDSPADDEIEVKTSQSLEENLKDLVNTSGVENIYLEIPEVDLDAVIASNEEIHQEIDGFFNVQEKRFAEECPSLFKAHGSVFSAADESFSKFKKSAQKEVSYLVKEFECRKSAASYARSSVARTGVLDCSKLHTYKYNEDLFKKVTSLSEGKNHGLVFILDWSGSMSRVLQDTLKQLYNLIWFCKKVNIPFDVYAFTNEWNHAHWDWKTGAYLHADTTPLYKKKQHVLSLNDDFSLMNLFTSKTRIKDLEKQMRNVWRLAQSFMGGYNNHYSYPMRLSLSGTPLNESLVCLHQLLPQFKKEHNLQKVQCIVLSDGEANPLPYHVEVQRRPDEEPYMGCRRINPGIMSLRDRKLGKVYSIDYHWHQFTDLLLQNLRDNFPSVNFIGIRVLESRDANGFIRMYNETNTDEYLKTVNEWKKTRSFKIKTSGYHAYFGLSSNTLSQNSEFDVDDGATKAKIKSAFVKSLKTKKLNKKVLGEFMELVA
jgi:hypothetical protein|tara:strand:- start:539 stop:2683 length:2145 start_codon:yes stop_codon:yes gene_type:complete